MSKRLWITFVAAAVAAGLGFVAAAYPAGTGRDPGAPQATVHQGQRLAPAPAPKMSLAGAKPLGNPIAYGFVEYDGSLAATSGNVASEWNGTSHRYYIRITGVSYSGGPYITFVTPVGNGGIYFPATWEDGGALVVSIGESSGHSGAQASFQFITYKIS
jgi:hypothetical protein